MPLVLVPMVGAAPVVPIIAISAMFTNTRAAVAFRSSLEPRLALIALIAALPICALGAWLYTLLTGRGAAHRDRLDTDRHRAAAADSQAPRPSSRRKGFCAGAAGWGFLIGGTSGAGVILLSLLMAAGLEGAAVIATDAAVSIVTGAVKIAVFGIAGVLTPKVHR